MVDECIRCRKLEGSIPLRGAKNAVQCFDFVLYEALSVVQLTPLQGWHQESGNYWGHNAIIRTEAFAQAAGLPRGSVARPTLPRDRA